MQLMDPLIRAAQVEAIVMKGIARSYDLDKFRFQKFYGGIVTGGARGCQLDCGPCWNAERNANPSGGGAFLMPENVVVRLEKLAGRKTDKARISGCEPILGRASARHLAEVIGKSRLQFVIETNGVAIGYDPEILDIFEGLDNYRIRVSLKATNGLMWEKFTGTNAWGFVYQQRGVKTLVERHIKHSIAFMPKFIDYREIDYDNPYALEDENMRYYPGTMARLLERGL